MSLISSVYLVVVIIVLIALAIYLIPLTVLFGKINKNGTASPSQAKNYMYVNIAMIFILVLVAIIGGVMAVMGARTPEKTIIAVDGSPVTAV